jgi:hypothetical protein
MKSMVLCVMVVIMFVAADAAYGMGGGGHHGDGRQDFSQQAGTSDCSSHNGSNSNTGDSDNGFVITAWRTSVSVPEPMAVLLLGLGIIGLAGVRRKFRK